MEVGGGEEFLNFIKQATLFKKGMLRETNEVQGRSRREGLHKSAGGRQR